MREGEGTGEEGGKRPTKGREQEGLGMDEWLEGGGTRGGRREKA